MHSRVGLFWQRRSYIDITVEKWYCNLPMEIDKHTGVGRIPFVIFPLRENLEYAKIIYGPSER